MALKPLHDLKTEAILFQSRGKWPVRKSLVNKDGITLIDDLDSLLGGTGKGLS